MTDSIFIEGIELIPVHRSHANRYVLEHPDLKEVTGVRYGADGWLHSDQGRIYSMHNRRFLTADQIDAVYPEARNRKHA